MRQLEHRIKTIAREHGAALVGFASRERLSDAPPSGDPGYLLPSAQSIISFGIPYDRKALAEFFNKTTWRSFHLDKRDNTRRLYVISDHVVDFLRGEGFDALTVDINSNYRPEPGAQDVSEIVAMNPDFSHRYGAVAAGLGRLGWSGNVMTPQYGSAILLGTVLTSATLHADPILEENPCDGCKMCVASCPVEMMHKTESVTIHIAGICEEIARKRTNNCCWIGCDGYHGLSPDRTWSNWSPYRVETPFPTEDPVVDALCTRLRKADPDANPEESNVYTNYRKSYFDPTYMFLSVCGHCANVCRPNRNDRIENWKRLVNSGIVVLRANGERSVVPNEEVIVEMATPFHVNVALLREEYEAAVRGEISLEDEKASTLSDRMVLRRFHNLRKLTG
ncbi:MAG: epoxyqueuosine reductase [bacterium]|nr:epoxyqueuosine reductase [bacterium]